MKIKFFLFIGALTVLLLGSHLFLNRVGSNISEDDLMAINLIKEMLDCNQVNSFIDEIECINSVQKATLSIVSSDPCPTHDCCPLKGETIEPIIFIKRGWGCCFDRARFNEKILNNYGFETRRVFLIEKKYLPIFNFLPLNQSSHAATEVKTSYGWMGVDSNSNTKLINYKTNQVYSYRKALSERPHEIELVPEYMFINKPSVIYGLHSRHGTSYKPNIPGPEFNLNEIKYNFLGD